VAWAIHRTSHYPSGPRRDVLSSSLPAVGGIEIGPAGVPGGSFRPVTVTVEPAMTAQATFVPHAVTFTVQNPAPYYYQYEYRFLSISWRNLETGQADQMTGFLGTASERGGIG
jgi:hypothetical protein